MTAFRNWLESRYCCPAYGALVLAGIALCFFGAAINTMVGWLYAISGTLLALLAIAFWLPPRTLRALNVRRAPLVPVTAGDLLSVELTVENASTSPVSLLTIGDGIPSVLGAPPVQAIDTIAPGRNYVWRYDCPAPRRGIYRWHEVRMRTAAPLGLFWCRRDRDAPAKAIVYPQILPLKNCPLLDLAGADDNTNFERERRYYAAVSGLTRGVRPYRHGDPPRSIHWRSSARFGELRVRELELATSGATVTIALDSAATWEADAFERAAIAAASLYTYAQRHQLGVQLWTAGTGMIGSNTGVMEVLAAVTPQEAGAARPQSEPTIWLTPHPTDLDGLAPGSHWLLFLAAGRAIAPVTSRVPGLVVTAEERLELQLQRSPDRR
ncbi:hypothetical protein KR51_00003140 [Rubidibacter lacunae KORDI 51-2]|uniref:DUF58 domain-containing protein n=1 Tax=Rubidibacter lacunae KORDI 51-2 TaxID=582515 RepID=U5DES6_9CHRO|nr:DUF58 domain-containing protein [Rubidibacter lacunae]ERN43003.1 hypothetical protein KR51_00003140 [Rubidibacter lacunae KORDI 51-2]